MRPVPWTSPLPESRAPPGPTHLGLQCAPSNPSEPHALPALSDLPHKQEIHLSPDSGGGGSEERDTAGHAPQTPWSTATVGSDGRGPGGQTTSCLRGPGWEPGGTHPGRGGSFAFVETKQHPSPCDPSCGNMVTPAPCGVSEPGGPSPPTTTPSCSWASCRAMSPRQRARGHHYAPPWKWKVAPA